MRIQNDMKAIRYILLTAMLLALLPKEAYSQCNNMSIPYFQGFEAIPQDSLPTCWIRTQPATDYYNISYPRVYDYDFYAHTGSRSLQFAPIYGSQMVITPIVPLDPDAIEVVFWAQGGGGELQVGYTTSNNVGAAFHPVATVYPSYEYGYYAIQFDTVTASQNVYVAFRAPESWDYNLIIDDVTIREVSPCAIPQNLVVSNTASGMVQLAWDDTASSRWQVAFGPSGFDPDMADTSDMVTTASPSAAISFLSDNTVYDFYVRSICSGQAGYWSFPLTARPNIATMPLYGSDTLRACGITIADDGNVFGSYSTYADQTLVIYPTHPDSAIRISGWVNISDMDHLEVYAGVGTGGRLLADWSGYQEGVSATSQVGAMTLHFTSSYYAYEGFELFAECFTRPDCVDPYNLQVSEVTGSSAKLSWEYDTVTPTQAFVIEVWDDADIFFLQYIVADTTREYTLTGLNQLTLHHVSVKSHCFANNSYSQEVVASFSTVCNAGGMISTGNDSINSVGLPTYSGMPYSLGQMIYDQSEVEHARHIRGIRFYVSDSYGDENRMLEIYMDTTSTNYYTSAGAIILQDSTTRLFSGTHTMTLGWNELMFDTVYNYPGSGNLVVTFNDLTGLYGNAFVIWGSEVSPARGSYLFNYSGALDPTDSASLMEVPFYSTGITTVRPNLELLVDCGEDYCTAPVILQTTSTAHSITLAWESGSNDPCRVQYSPYGTHVWTTATASTTASSITIGGLNDGTEYILRLSSLCDTLGTISTTRCYTKCAPAPLPLTEGFETFAATMDEGFTELCWHRYSEYSTSMFYPNVTEYYAHTGTRCLSMSYYNDRIILPELQVAVDSTTLSFAFYGQYPEYYNHSIIVGVMDDPEVASTFTPVDTIDYYIYLTSEEVWQEVVVDMDSYTGTGRYIALATPYDPYIPGLYLDDIKVERLNFCRPPINTTLSNITTNSIQLSFTDNNHADSYTLVYGTSPEMADATDSVTFTTTNYTLNGLAHSTHYYLWLHSNCGSDGHSRVVYVGDFATVCPLVIINDSATYYEDFERQELSVCMAVERLSGNVDWKLANSDVAHFSPWSGQKMVHIASYSDATTRLTLPEMDMSMLSRNAELTFHFNRPDNGYTMTQLSLYYRANEDTSWTLVEDFNTPISRWTTAYVSLPNSAGASSYQLAFVASQLDYTGIAIDDIDVHAAPTCERPTITAITSTGSSATIHWTGTAEQYRVEYREEGDWSWYYLDVAGNSTLIEGLQPVTNYEVRLRAHCGLMDYSYWSEQAAFRTTICSDHNAYVNYDTSMVATTLANAPLAYPSSNSYNEVLVDHERLAGLDVITAIALNPATTAATSRISDFSIFLGHTNDTVLNTLHYTDSFAEVYRGRLELSDTGWTYLLLAEPFVWDGVSNLVVGMLANNVYWNSMAQFDGHDYGRNVSVSATNNYYTITPGETDSLPYTTLEVMTSAPDILFLSCANVCEKPFITYHTTGEEKVELYFRSHGSYFQVQYQPAGGSWSDTIEFADPLLGYNHVFELEGLHPQTQYTLRIRQNCSAVGADYSEWVTLVVTTDTICTPPTGFQVERVDGNSVTFSWVSGAFQSLWEIHVEGDNFDRTYLATESPYTAEGLEVGNSYTATIRAMCDCGNRAVSGYAETVSFNNYCTSIRQIFTTYHDGEVQLRWTPDPRHQRWMVAYGHEHGAVFEGTDFIIVDEPQATINGIMADTVYVFRVRPLCGEYWYGDWTEETLSTRTTGIDEVVPTPDFDIYPNPTTSQFTVAINGTEGPVEMRILDLAGRLVYSETILGATNGSNRLLVTDIEPGVYFVQIVGKQLTAVKKLVVR